MDPITIIAAANAAMSLMEALVPQIRNLVSRGEITVEQQQELLKKYNSLKTQADGQFTGPEWEVK